jgi:hypothetical protein
VTIQTILDPAHPHAVTGTCLNLSNLTNPEVNPTYTYIPYGDEPFMNREYDDHGRQRPTFPFTDPAAGV